jgi:lipoprotein-anchoring transpeptidase ErfK/SrfK
MLTLEGNVVVSIESDHYGVGVGREGFTWNGNERVTKMAEWLDWHPPEEMIERQPYLPRFTISKLEEQNGARMELGQR